MLRNHFAAAMRSVAAVLAGGIVLAMLATLFAAPAEGAPTLTPNTASTLASSAPAENTAPLITQNNAPISGRVVEDKTGNALPGVHVLLVDEQRGAITDADGRFTIKTAGPGSYELVARFVGFEEFRQEVEVPSAGLAGLEVRLVEGSVLLDGVVVSATRERQARSDVAAAIGSVDAETIAEVNPSHPSEIMGRIPGVWVNQTAGEGHMMAIRQPLSIEPLYLYLENGVPTRSTGFFNHNALYEINVPQADGIEVIKGPGTALYGSDAIGGVINVNSAPAPMEPTVSSTIEGGSFGYKRAQISAGTTFGQDGLQLDMHMTDSDGWREDTPYSRQSATLRWDRRLGNRTLVQTVASWSNIDQAPAGASAISEADFRDDARQNYTPISYRKVQAYRLSTVVERYAGRTLLSATPFFRYNVMDLIPNWSLSYDPTIWETINYSVGALLKYRVNLEPMRTQVVVGADLDISPGNRTEIAISPTREDGVFTLYDRGSSAYDYDVTFRQASPYVHAEFSPVESVRLSGGFRFDMLGYDYSNNLSVVQTGTHRRPESDVRTFMHASPKLGVTFQLNPHANVFASYRHAFRVPSESQLFRQGSAENTIDLQPVRADNFELGVRGRVHARAGYELTAYSMQKSDDIVGYVFPDGTQGSVNAGRTSHRGVEAGLDLEPVPALSLYGNLTYARHTYEDWEIDTEESYTGNEMETAPRVTAGAAATLRLPVLQGASVTLEWNRVGDYWLDPANSGKYEGHDVLNVKTNIRVMSGVSVLAKVNNVTDQLYAERATYNAFRGDEYLPGLPRNVHISLRYEFN